MQWERSLLTDVELLSAADCGRVRDGLNSLRGLWVERQQVIPGFTLGAAHYFAYYFDKTNNPQFQYYRMARELNPILMRELGWMYEALASRLQGLFQLPVEYPAKLALPGFNIIPAHEALRNPPAVMDGERQRKKDDPSFVATPIHCDLLQHAVDWSGIDDVSLAQPISITLAIALPEACPSGMWVWDVYAQDTANMPEPQIKAILQAHPPRLHEYRVGCFCLHSGLRYHSIAPFLLAPSQQFQPGDVRITLQGHGIIGQKSIKLYW